MTERSWNEKEEVKIYTILSELKNWLTITMTIIEPIILALFLSNTIPLEQVSYLFLIVHLGIIFFFSLLLAFKYLNHIPSSKKIFTPYIRELADLTHQDLKDFKAMRKWYVSLEVEECILPFIRGDLVEWSDINERERSHIFIKKEISRIARFKSRKHRYFNDFYENEISKQSFFVLDSFLDEWKKKKDNFQPLIILGTAGTGKSTTLKFIAHKWAKEWIKNKKGPIPLFMPLRKWIPTIRSEGDRLARTGFGDYFREENCIKEFNWAKFKRLVSTGEAILILDGFDEILSIADNRVIQNYAESIFSIMSEKSKVVFTSRPEAFSSWSDISKIFPIYIARELNISPNKIFFKPIKIKLLSKKLIKKVIDLRRNHDIELKQKEIDIGSLTHYENLEKLAERAILLQFIFDLFIILENKDEQDELQQILSKKFTERRLFDLYTTAWLKREQKKKTINTSIEERIPLIKDLAWISLDEGLVLSDTQIRNTILNHFPLINLEKTMKIEQDIRTASFIEHFERVDTYQFHHKSFAEFFVAKDIETKGDNEKNDLIDRFLGFDPATKRGILVFASENLCKTIVQNIKPLLLGNNIDKQIWLQSWVILCTFDPMAVEMLQRKDIGLIWDQNLPQKYLYKKGDEDRYFIKFLDDNLIGFNLFGIGIKEFPACIFSFFSSIKTINLSENRLLALPETVYSLKQLESLTIAGNQLKSLPDTIGNLSQLKSLNIAGNQLKSLPDTIGNLSQLKNLNITGNQLKSLPDTIGNLSQLKSLNIARNQLKSLPDTISNLTQLKSLNIAGNQLKNLPDTISNLIQLKELNLNNNGLLGLPISLGEMTKLEALRVEENQLQNLPDSIGKLVNLQELKLSDNKLVDLPNTINSMIRLRKLDISHNQIRNLPEFMVNLSQLSILEAEFNELETFPISILKLPELLRANFRGNKQCLIPKKLEEVKQSSMLIILHDRIIHPS